MYLLVLCVLLIGIALAGIATNRHFIIIMLGIELIFLATTIALLSFFSYSARPDPGGVILLLSVWTVAAVEIIAVIAIYVYMKSRGFDFDVSLLTRLRW